MAQDLGSMVAPLRRFVVLSRTCQALEALDKISRRPARGIAFVTLEQRIAEELRLSQCIAPQVVFCLTCSQTLEITTEPSPTAEATRFTDPARTSPTAKMPG